MQVYIVDEEYHFAQNVASAFRFEGNEAVVFQDATEALKYFERKIGEIVPMDIRILVDVSLAAGDDLEIFSREATDDFYETGIVLVKELMSRCVGLCLPENTILYTAHFATPLWDRIDVFCKKNGFRNWQKTPNSDVDDVMRLV